jgi:valyl-tRNA synthetase
METAYDLIFFWVARMIFMGIEDTGEIPFRTVYFHGLIRDDKGDKMSKTRGNVVDPLDLVAQYGTDALRFALVMGTSAGNDSKLAAAKLEAGRNFANKLWNATRFVIRSIASGAGTNAVIDKGKLLPEDRWILSRLNRSIASAVGLLESFQFGEAQRQIHDFLWGEYCDWYIEMAKIRLQANDNSPLPVLVHVLEKALRLLHPFMPFLTEELWQNLKKQVQWIEGDSIMVAAYPEADEAMTDPAAEAEIEAVTEIVRAIRNVRAEYKVETSRWIEARIHTDASRHATISRYAVAVRTLARANPVTFLAGEPGEKAYKNTLVLPLAPATVVIPMASMLDLGAEKKKIEKELEQTRAEAKRLETRLKDEAFLTKAPPAVIEKERQKLYTLKDKLEKLQQQSSRF